MSRNIILKQVRTDEYWSVDEAARYLGIKPTAIRNYLCDERLTTYKFKGWTLLSIAEVKQRKEAKKKKRK